MHSDGCCILPFDTFTYKSNTVLLISVLEDFSARLLFRCCTLRIVTTCGYAGLWKIKVSGWSKVASWKHHRDFQYLLETSALVRTYSSQATTTPQPQKNPLIFSHQFCSLPVST